MLQQLASIHTSSTNFSWGLFVPIMAIAWAVVVFEVVGVWVVFKKAGRPGWAAIVPIYNFWVMFEIAGKPGWWALSFLLVVIPFAGLIPLILEIIALLEVAKRFGKSAVFAIFGLLLFGFVGWPMLAYGDAKYQVPSNTPQAGTTPPQTPVNPTAPPEPPTNPA